MEGNARGRQPILGSRHESKRSDKRQKRGSLFLDGSRSQRERFCEVVHEYVQGYSLGRTLTLTTITEFYADDNGVETSKSNPDVIKVVFRLVLNFDTHQMTKFVERSTGSTNGYHLEDRRVC